MAEHDPVLSQQLESVVRNWGYDVILAQDVNAVWATFYQVDVPEMVILNWTMPGINGSELCQRIRARTDIPYVYFILLTESKNTQDIVEGMEADVDDFIAKPFGARELKMRLRAGQRILNLQAKVREAERIIAFQSTRDIVTGMWNREVMLDFLGREMNRARRAWEPVSVILLAADGLEQVRLVHGEAAYQSVLQEMSKRIESAVRSYDTLGRYTEHEFMAILPGCNEARVLLVAERMLRTVSEDPFDILAGELPITLHLGMSTMTDDKGADAIRLVKAAESSLEQARVRNQQRR